MYEYEEYIDLFNMEKAGDISHSEAMSCMYERAGDGISREDMKDFENFFDVMMLNAVMKLYDSHAISKPEHMTEIEWRNKLDELLDVLLDISHNTGIYLKSDYKDFEDYVQYSAYCDSIKLKNRKLRREVFKFLDKYIGDMNAY